MPTARGGQFTEAAARVIREITEAQDIPNVPLHTPMRFRNVLRLMITSDPAPGISSHLVNTTQPYTPTLVSNGGCCITRRWPNA